MHDKTVSVELSQFEAEALADLYARARSADLFHLGMTREGAFFALCGMRKAAEALAGVVLGDDNARSDK